ncbi:TPA: phage holin [Escherichia coli]
MYRMEKITTGIAYGASGGGTGYWLLQLLDKVSPSQWAAIVLIHLKYEKNREDIGLFGIWRD